MQQSDSSELKISPKNSRKQSKEQQNFNRLNERIKKLESALLTDAQKGELLVQLFEKTITPKQIKIAEAKIKLAFALDDVTNRERLSSKVTHLIKQSIVILIHEALEFIPVTDEIEFLYDNWGDITYQEFIREQKSAQKDEFAAYMEYMYGAKVSVDDFDIDDPESIAKYHAKIKSAFEQKESNKESFNAQAKSQKRLEREAKQKLVEDEQLKNIRSIYIALTKVLHPDLEPDENLKKEKLEIMQTVTAAYEQKDLSRLLQLELKWVAKSPEHLEKLPEDKLKSYIKVLKDRVADLEKERFSLQRNPRFKKVRDYISFPEKEAISCIEKDVKGYEKQFRSFDSNANLLNRLRDKGQIVDFVKQFHEAYFPDEYYVW